MKYYKLSLTTPFPVFFNHVKTTCLMHFESMDTERNYVGITERKRKKVDRIDRDNVG